MSLDRHPEVTDPPVGWSNMVDMVLRPALARADVIDPTPPIAVSVDTIDGLRVVTVTIEDQLDVAAARALIDVANTVIAHGIDRLDIDLRMLDGFTTEGVVALVTCRELCRSLPRGLHYRTGTGPGREALLAAYEQDQQG